jgi:hypothetical protein
MADTFLGDKSGRTGKAGGSGDAGESPARHNNPIPWLGEEGTRKEKLAVILLLLWKDG